MPLYYFNLRNDVQVDDPEGTELANVEAAREQALEEARAVVCHSVKEGHLNLDHYIEVVDEAGEHVLTLTFRDAFTIEG